MNKSILFLIGLITLIPTLAQAQAVDLIWQGNSYTPPFYEGRPLWASQTSGVVMAIPQIPSISNTSNLIYKWTKDNTVLGTVSGVGKNSLFINDPVLGNTQEIKVEVVGLDGGVLATNTINLTPTNQSLLVYEKNPLLGYVFNKEVGVGYRMPGEEITFTAFPLFFSTYSFTDPDIEYSWSTRSSSDTGPSVTYRVPENSYGTTQVSIRVKNSTQLIQSGSKSFLVEFGNSRL